MFALSLVLVMLKMQALEFFFFFLIALEENRNSVQQGWSEWVCRPDAKCMQNMLFFPVTCFLLVLGLWCCPHPFSAVQILPVARERRTLVPTFSWLFAGWRSSWLRKFGMNAVEKIFFLLFERWGRRER